MGYARDPIDRCPVRDCRKRAFATSDTLVKLLSTRYPIFQIIAMQASVACLIVGIVIWRDKAYMLLAIRNP